MALCLRLCGLLLGAATLIGQPVLAQYAQPQTSPLAAIDQLIGNTLLYHPETQSNRERGIFLRPDGTGLAGTAGRQPAKAIRWAMLSEGGLCLYAPEQRPTEGTCGRLELGPEYARLIPEDAPLLALRLLAGDAWGLDPELRGKPLQQGAKAIAQLEGNTLVLHPLGSPGPERQAFHFMTDGRLRRADSAAPEATDWQMLPEERWSSRASDAALCLQAPEGQESCYAVEVQGTSVSLRHDGDDVRIFGRLLRGDARHLSPEAEASALRLGRQLVGRSLRLTAAARGAAKDTLLYFQADGSGLAQSGSAAPVPIGWQVRPGGTLCLTPMPPGRAAPECIQLAIHDGIAVLSAPDRPTLAAPLGTESP